MANQVVVPFPGPRYRRPEPFSTRDWSLKTDEPPRSRWRTRLSTARQVVRAVVETLSYLAEPRVYPPAPPALPPRRDAR